MSTQNLARNLRAARDAAGLSQQQAAAVVGIHHTALSDIEHGGRAVSALELKAFAELYGTSADELLDNPPIEPVVRTPEQALARLEKVTSDLDSHLEQRAREIAQPVIDHAGAAAELRVQRAERDLERANDLVAELRRQLESAVAGMARAQHSAGLRHDKEYCEHCKTETVVVIR